MDKYRRVIHNCEAFFINNVSVFAVGYGLRYDCLMKSSLAILAKRSKTKNKVGRKQHPATLAIPARLRRLFYVYLICILASALAATILATRHSAAPLPDPFSAQQRTAVAFRLYYPTTLPKPFYIDLASLGRLEQSVVAMRITDGSGNSQAFTISQQLLPQHIDLEAFYKSFDGRITFPTDIGLATAGIIDSGNTRIVSIVSQDKTWILIQAPSAVSLETLQNTLDSLTASR